MKNHNIIEATVGAFVVIAAVIFFYFGYTSTHHEANKTYRLYALFDRIDGLNIGNDVRMSGVKIGYVESFELDPQSYQAKVALRVKHDLKLSTDTRAEISSESLMGGKYLALTPGAETEVFKENGVITQTQSSVNLENMIGKMMFHQGSSERKK